jgi:hypothetical protein
MTELTPADNTRNPSKAPAPSTASAYAAYEANQGSNSNNHNAAGSLNILSNFMQEQDFVESAYSANESDSSIETKKSTKSTMRSKSNSRGHQSNSRNNNKTVKGNWQDNPCKHCKKYKYRNQHPYNPSSKCFWNEKKVGWRPKWVYEAMEIKYKPHHMFTDAEDSEFRGGDQTDGLW